MGIFDQIKNAFGGKAEPAETESSATTGEEESATYTVQSGDTLWKISEQVYGDGASYMKIFEANTGLLESPDQIFPGQELKIPKINS